MLEKSLRRSLLERHGVCVDDYRRAADAGDYELSRELMAEVDRIQRMLDTDDRARGWCDE